MLLRSFALQGSWNYRTLIGTGFAFALLPALRTLFRADPARLHDAARRHTALFNSHPYLAPIALAVVARLEAEGESPAVIDRFKTAVRGSLGSLGDRLVWAGWRPVCLLAALAALFAGAPWYAALLGFLLLYNAGHLATRIWGYRIGLHEGKHVGERLRHSRLAHAQHALNTAGAFLVGLLLPFAAAGAAFAPLPVPPPSAPAVALATLAAALGTRFGTAVRLPAALALAALAAIGIALRFAA